MNILGYTQRCIYADHEALFEKLKEKNKNLIYTHLVEFGNCEFFCKAAMRLQEAFALIEQGFEFAADLDEVKLFRKAK